MANAAQRLSAVWERIHAAERRFHRPVGAVALVAVSKTHDAQMIRQVAAAGQHRFGESYLQEALVKLEALKDEHLEWHFIGPIQSNKTGPISAHFDWVHSVERWKVARRLNEQRPETLRPLNVCLEVNVSGELSKSGVAPADLLELARAVAGLPRLRLRGLMTVPAPVADFAAQRAPLAALRRLWDQLREAGLDLDTLSMGMSDDLEAAVAEGATLVRVGTAIFGPRER